MIERIDHLLAVVDDFQTAVDAWTGAGCPQVWNGRTGMHGSCCVSIGPINLELLSEEVFDGWPPLARWPEWTTRKFGLHAAALDPGDLAATLAELRAVGLAPTPPREGRLQPHADAPDGTGLRWRNSTVDGLTGLLPGLPSFLCEFLAPRARLGRDAPNSPIRFVELQVGVQDPAAAASTYERILKVRSIEERDSFLVPLADTPIRLVAGGSLSALLETRLPDSLTASLARIVPGITFGAVQHRSDSAGGRDGTRT